VSQTTIKVDPSVRDRLAQVARARGVSMGILLDVESQRLLREQRWREIKDAYRRLQEDPDSWQGYLDELAEWESGVTDADVTAGEDWPEFNQ